MSITSTQRGLHPMGADRILKGRSANIHRAANARVKRENESHSEHGFRPLTPESIPGSELSAISSRSVYFGNARRNQDDEGPRVAKKYQEGESSESSGGDIGDECEKAWWPAKDYVVQLQKAARGMVYSIFGAWLSSGVFELPAGFTLEQTTSRVLDLIDCFIFGEREGHEEFKNQVIDHFLRNEQQMLHFGGSSLVCRPVIQKVYKYTPPDSPLRKLLVDLTVATMPRDMEALVPHWNPCVEYIQDVFRAYQKAIDSGRVKSPFQKGPCEYHTHSGRPAAYRCVGDRCVADWYTRD